MMGLKRASGPAIVAFLPLIPVWTFYDNVKKQFVPSFEDASLLLTSRLDGWDIPCVASVEQREDFRRFLVDAHKASYVPVCVANSLVTAEPAIVIPTKDDLEDIPESFEVSSDETGSSENETALEVSKGNSKGITDFEEHTRYAADTKLDDVEEISISVPSTDLLADMPVTCSSTDVGISVALSEIAPQGCTTRGIKENGENTSYIQELINVDNETRVVEENTSSVLEGQESKYVGTEIPKQHGGIIRRVAMMNEESTQALLDQLSINEDGSFRWIPAKQMSTKKVR